MQGGTDEVTSALARADLDEAPVSPAERMLLQFVRRLTERPWKMTARDADELRQADWRDEQIAEAVYITGLFAFFNRVADAFGLEDPNYGGLSLDGDVQDAHDPETG